MSILSLPHYISNDIVLEILLFLTRNESEKCHLVSQKWHHLITTRYSLLPLRRFTTISFNNHTHAITINNVSFKIEARSSTPYLISLKYSIFDYFKLDNLNQLDLIQKLGSITGLKLQLVSFIIKPSKLIHVPWILKNYFSTKEVTISCTNFSKILGCIEEPKQLQEVAKFTEVRLESLEFPSRYSEHHEAAMDFVMRINGVVGENLTTFHFATFNFVAFKKIIENFKNSDAPQDFIKNIIFYLTPSDFDFNTIDYAPQVPIIAVVHTFLQSQAVNYDLIRQENVMGQNYRYNISREDDWKMEILIQEERMYRMEDHSRNFIEADVRYKVHMSVCK